MEANQVEVYVYSSTACVQHILLTSSYVIVLPLDHDNNWRRHMGAVDCRSPDFRINFFAVTKLPAPRTERQGEHRRKPGEVSPDVTTAQQTDVRDRETTDTFSCESRADREWNRICRKEKKRKATSVKLLGLDELFSEQTRNVACLRD